ncbi:MAG TPA: hypothetical protein VNA14_05525 [Mycobacteriales bacterium]|nr:hypothetical protein [Mycobacteriales bacterium]
MTVATAVVAVVAGLLTVLATLSSVVRTLVIPRGFASRLTASVERVVHSGYHLVVDRISSYERKDRILATEAPTVLLGLLTTWLVLLVAGFGLLLHGVEDITLGSALREAASSLFTLGFATTATGGATVIDVVAAAVGLVIVALQIAYLPTLYAAFNRREVLVTTLESRAGVPAWGPELLTRHALVNSLDNLPMLYAQWEAWAADVAESHTNYPILVSFRSPKALRSWVVALLAVMDSAALYLALCPSTAPSATRLSLRMGFTCMRDIADAIGLHYDPDPLPTDPLQLTYDEYLAGIARMKMQSFPMERTPEEAWPHFCGWRVNYESIAYALADRTSAVPGQWTGERSRMDATPIKVIPPPNRTPERPDGVGPPKPGEFGRS